MSSTDDLLDLDDDVNPLDGLRETAASIQRDVADATAAPAAATGDDLLARARAMLAERSAAAASEPGSPAAAPAAAAAGDVAEAPAEAPVDTDADADRLPATSDDPHVRAAILREAEAEESERFRSELDDDYFHAVERSQDLGAALVAAKVIDDQLLETGRAIVRSTPGSQLARIFREAGVDERALQRVVADLAGLRFERVSMDTLEAGKHYQRLGPRYCRDHGVIPIRLAHGRLVVGVVDPDDLILLDEVRYKLGLNVKCVVVPATDIDAITGESLEGAGYGNDDADSGGDAASAFSMEEMLDDIEEDDVAVVENKDDDLDLEKIAGESPVIRYVNFLIFNAVKEGASDIHIEPQEKRLQVRYRIDGILSDAQSPPAHMAAAVISRLKIMGNLDIAERRLPQDGRIRAMVHGRKLDLRLSTLPMVTGEKAVLRILDSKSIQVELEDLGMDEDCYSIWMNQIMNPNGIVLVTGPTGSGKTTTLYSSLGKMDRKRLNISTAEDPVEYHLNGINQTPVNHKIGMTFAAALRALLRQDPDVIMVGEIRDHDTAKTAIEASLTGHLVLSTLHTNDAPSTITRLINIGVEPYLVGSAVNACLAQRLVRKICPNCEEHFKPEDDVLEAMAMQGVACDEIFKGKGCDKCRQTGYSGRLGLYELLVMNDNLRDRVAGNPNVTEFRRQCVELGMISLRQDGYRKIAAGQTTIDEILRVTESTI